jgi:hypothetical protein
MKNVKLKIMPRLSAEHFEGWVQIAAVEIKPDTGG